MITGVPVETSIPISAFPRVPLTEKEIWMDEHFQFAWETAVDWNSDDQSKGYDGDGLTNEEEWKYRTDPFLADTDGDTLADKLETEATFTNPLSKDTDGDGFPDNIELDISGLDPLAYNLAPPIPEFTFESGQETMTFAAASFSLVRSSRSHQSTEAARSRNWSYPWKAIFASRQLLERRVAGFPISPFRNLSRQLQGQRFLEPRIFKDPIHRCYRP